MVVAKDGYITPELLEAETHWLNNTLNKVEALRNVAAACEVIDMNRYRIVRKQQKVMEVMATGKHRPFIFVYNKN